MVRRYLLLCLGALSLLAGCSANFSKEQPVELGGGCNVDSLRAALGQMASAERVSWLQQRSKAKVVRVLAPGDAATMDYNPQRLNIDIDESEAIIRLTCG